MSSKRIALRENFRELTIDTVGVCGGVARGRKNPLWQGLADRLKKLRDYAGLTQAEVGNAAGCGGSVIHFIEAGRRPGVDTLARIAAALNVPPCWLAFGPDGDEPFREKVPRPEPPPEPPPAKLIDSKQVVATEGLADRLTTARQAARLSMRELARCAALSVNTISLLEAGRGVPRIDSCEALARALNVAPCWLAYGVGRGPVATAPE